MKNNMKRFTLIYAALILISLSGGLLADEVKSEEVSVLIDVIDIDWGIGDDDSSSGYD